MNENLRLWDIYTKVMFQAFAWGAGTAIGELPPYFVAKAGIVTILHCFVFDLIFFSSASCYGWSRR